MNMAKKQLTIHPPSLTLNAFWQSSMVDLARLTSFLGGSKNLRSSGCGGGSGFVVMSGTIAQ